MIYSISSSYAIQWNLSIVDRSKCPDYRGVLISEIAVYTKATIRTQDYINCSKGRKRFCCCVYNYYYYY